MSWGRLSWEAKRGAVLAEADFTCQICGLRKANHVDHIWPRLKGGRDDRENLRAACSPCNTAKGAEVWLSDVRTSPLVAMQGYDWAIENAQQSMLQAAYWRQLALSPPAEDEELIGEGLALPKEFFAAFNSAMGWLEDLWVTRCTDPTPTTADKVTLPDSVYVGGRDVALSLLTANELHLLALRVGRCPAPNSPAIADAIWRLADAHDRAAERERADRRFEALCDEYRAKHRAELEPGGKFS